MRWNEACAIAAVLAIAGLAPSGPAAAQASLQVQPLNVDVQAPGQTSSVTLRNTGTRAISLQIRVFGWSQVDGVDHLDPTGDVVVSPPAATIPAESTYTIRLARTAGPPVAGEKAYRLWVDELPPAIPPRTGGGEVHVRLRYDLPVFFHARGITGELAWRAHRSGSDIVIEAINSGARHVRITDLRLTGPQGDVSFGAGLNGYVLGNNTRRWTAPAGVLTSASQNITVVAGISGSEVHQPITIASN